ncbi:hypothetical protein ACIBF6_20050 [Streptosporangium amethystogenes]|uniref:hypothetical protein n=1 Tax=Streptosporangium amethystogenes TaxID=2002 RepID=UPI0037A24C2F
MVSAVPVSPAAIGDAPASVLRRRAARSAPQRKAFRLALIMALIRDPAWLGGIAALIAGFIFQAAVLSQARLGRQARPVTVKS